MDETTKPSPGWFPNPSQPGMLRYWDGERWTEHTAPAAPPASNGPSAWTIARGVALGVAAVIAGLVFLGQCAASDDKLDCANQNAERALDGLPPIDCN